MARFVVIVEIAMTINDLGVVRRYAWFAWCGRHLIKNQRLSEIYDGPSALCVLLLVVEGRPLGVVAPDEEFSVHGGSDMYAVVNEDMSRVRDEARFKLAARLLAVIALAVDQHLYGDASAPIGRA